MMINIQSANSPHNQRFSFRRQGQGGDAGGGRTGLQRGLGDRMLPQQALVDLHPFPLAGRQANDQTPEEG